MFFINGRLSLLLTTAGVCYKNGTGVAQDPAEAVRLFRLAAEQGHAQAQCSLGSFRSLSISLHNVFH